MSHLISGIQQIGIGIPDADEAWKWYRCRFGMDIPMFKEAAEAPFMVDYTGKKTNLFIQCLYFNTGLLKLFR